MAMLGFILELMSWHLAELHPLVRIPVKPRAVWKCCWNFHGHFENTSGLSWCAFAGELTPVGAEAQVFLQPWISCGSESHFDNVVTVQKESEAWDDASASKLL